MAVYMITSHYTSATRNEIIKRFMNTDARTAPEGLKELGRWHRAESNGSYIVVETDDPKAISDWLLQWTDLASFEVQAVLTDEELGELFQKHGLG